MKKYLLISFAALAAMVSCEQEGGPVQGTEPAEGRREVTIVAEASETKTTLSDEDAVLWESGDAVRLLFTPEEGTGLSVHTEVFTTATPGATATFTGSIPNDVKYASDGSAYRDALYMVYPSTAMDENTGKVTFELDAVQSVAPGTFPSGLNLSSARVSFEALETNGTANATFLNAFSIIRFTLPANVKALKITGTANLAGEAELGFDTDADARLVAETFVSESKSVTLTPSEGNAFTEGETYNILVYPGTHSAITVELTDTDDCTYSNTVTQDFDFKAANYYTFNFNTDFGKDFGFTVSGVSIQEGEKVYAVFTDGAETHAYESVVTNDAFTVRLSHGENPTSGYAVYPAAAYSEGNVNYDLDALGTPAELYTAVLPLVGGSVTFNSVTDALSTMKFTVPAGVSSVNVTSNVGFAGKAVMTVGADGKMTAGAGDLKTLDSAAAGEVVLNVYPFSNATITVTLKDAAGAVNVQEFASQTVAAGAVLTLEVEQNIEFQKGGSFGGEGFTSGGGTIQF